MMQVRTLVWAIYPLLIYAGLAIFEPRVIALFVGAALLLRWRRDAATLLVGLSSAQWAAAALLISLTLVTALTNSELLLRCYPAAVNAALLVVFGLSLVHPPPLVERIARLSEPALSPVGVAYTRRVTVAWCAFFAGNGLLAAWTAAFATREVWALYNGLIAYVLMGALFAAELVCRRRTMAGDPGTRTLR